MQIFENVSPYKSQGMSRRNMTNLAQLSWIGFYIYSESQNQCDPIMLQTFYIYSPYYYERND